MSDESHARAPRSGVDRTPNALYLAVVVSLAAFLLLAILLPAPIEAYRSSAVVEQQLRLANDEVGDLRLLDAASARAIARDVFATRISGGGSPRFDDVVRLQLERFTPYQARLTIEVSDRYADHSQQICQSIAAAIIDGQPASYIPNLEALRSQRSDVDQRLALVRESKRALEEDLALLQRDHLAEYSTAVARTENATRRARAAAVAEVVTPSHEQRQLEAEIQQLMDERRELVATRTDRHPQVKQIDELLQEMSRRLSDLAIANVPTPEAASRGVVPDAALAGELWQLQENYRRRTEQAFDAIASAARREQDLLVEAARLQVTPLPIAVETKLSQPAEVVERIGGRPSSRRLSWHLAASLAAGAVAYVLLRWSTANRTLSSPDDVQQQLDLPVVSLLHAGSVTSRPKRERNLRRSILAAEGVLVVLAVSVSLLLASQSSLTTPVSSDPFGSVAEALDRSFSTTESSAIRRR
jgi:hypothetical protein